MDLKLLEKLDELFTDIREHQSLDYNYPAEIYFGNILLKVAA